MTKVVYQVSIADFFIRANNPDEMIDILWEKYGISLDQIRRTIIAKDAEFADND